MVNDPKNYTLRSLFFRKRKEYTTLLKRKSGQYTSQLLVAMDNLSINNPKDYDAGQLDNNRQCNGLDRRYKVSESRCHTNSSPCDPT
jgi:hypothetical protein